MGAISSYNIFVGVLRGGSLAHFTNFCSGFVVDEEEEIQLHLLLPGHDRDLQIWFLSDHRR